MPWGSWDNASVATTAKYLTPAPPGHGLTYGRMTPNTTLPEVL